MDILFDHLQYPSKNRMYRAKKKKKKTFIQEFGLCAVGQALFLLMEEGNGLDWGGGCEEVSKSLRDDNDNKFPSRDKKSRNQRERKENYQHTTLFTLPFSLSLYPNVRVHLKWTKCTHSWLESKVTSYRQSSSPSARTGVFDLHSKGGKKWTKCAPNELISRRWLWVILAISNWPLFTAPRELMTLSLSLSGIRATFSPFLSLSPAHQSLGSLWLIWLTSFLWLAAAPKCDLKPSSQQERERRKETDLGGRRKRRQKYCPQKSFLKIKMSAWV